MIADVAELLEEVAGGVVAVGGLFGEAAIDGPAEGRGDGALDRRRVFGEDGGHGLHGFGPLEGPAAGGHLVEDEAEGELVGAVVGGFAARLLGAHVVDGPEDHAGFGLVDGDGLVGADGGAEASLARPKSRILARPSGVTMMLAGLRSRWAMRAVWAAAMPSATWTAISSSLRTGTGRARAGGQGLTGNQLADGVDDAGFLADVVESDDIRDG